MQYLVYLKEKFYLSIKHISDLEHEIRKGIDITPILNIYIYKRRLINNLPRRFMASIK